MQRTDSEQERIRRERDRDDAARRDAVRRNAAKGVGRNLEEAVELVRTAQAFRDDFARAR